MNKCKFPIFPFLYDIYHMCYAGSIFSTRETSISPFVSLLKKQKISRQGALASAAATEAKKILHIVTYTSLKEKESVDSYALFCEMIF